MLKKQASSGTNPKIKQNFKKHIKPTIYAFSIAAVIIIGMVCLNLVYAALFSPKHTIMESQFVESQKKDIQFEADEKNDLPKFSNIEISLFTL